MVKQFIICMTALLLLTGLSSAAEPPCRQRVIQTCKADQEEMICRFLSFDQPETVESITEFLQAIGPMDEEMQKDLICARLMTVKKIMNIRADLALSEDSDGRYSFPSGIGIFRFQVDDPAYPKLIADHQKIEKLKLCGSKEIFFDIHAMISDADAQYQEQMLKSFTLVLDDVKLSNIHTIYTEGGFEAQRVPLKKGIRKEMDRLMRLGLSKETETDQTPLMERNASGGKSGYAKKSFTNSIGMEFVWIPVNPDEEDYFSCDKKNVSRPFYIGKYEVTQKQWESVMGNNPSNFKGLNLPVENVSWDDVQEFIRKLNEKERKNFYRLPSEIEWKHAARAGSTGAWCFGDDENLLEQYAWYDKNSGSTTHPVGQLKPNAFGLYDMHGNVWEWCEDADGSVRVVRGGSWNYGADYCRSGCRDSNSPDFRGSILGFRVLAVPAGRAK